MGLLDRGYRGASIDEVLAGSRRRLHVTFDDAFRDVLDVIPILERLRVPATIFVVTDFADEGAPFAVPELGMGPDVITERTMTMAWEELRELTTRGFTIGSHTVTHPHLTELGADEMARELQDSRSRIEEELGTPCRLFAYPYGEHDGRVQAAVRRAGYTSAFALSAGAGLENPYALPRVDLYRRDTALRARMKTSRVAPLAKAILSRVRTRSLP